MKPWIQQLMPWVLLLSLGANIHLGKTIWERDQQVNQVLWGNAARKLQQHVDLPASDLKVSREGSAQALTAVAVEIDTAQLVLESLQSFPGYQERIEHRDYQMLLHFLTYAEQAVRDAQQEYGTSGTLSDGTHQRLDGVRRGLSHMSRTLSRVNSLQDPKHTWDHGAWQGMFQEMTRGLEAMDLVPLDK